VTAFDGLPPTLEWVDGALRLVDQRRLPGELVFLDCRTVGAVADAISTLAVRGAPAIGAAAAYGVALGVLAAGADAGAQAEAGAEAGARSGDRLAAARAAAEELVATRPTAVNLAWGVRQVVDAVAAGGDALAVAHRIAAEDVAACRALGAHGAPLVPDGARILTHCNAGSLATVGYGTAVGVIRAAFDAGRVAHVWVDETRPVLQGARLTAWELDRLGIPATLVADVMAASLMATGDVDCVVVGADRIAANGDVANKIGTYGLAVLAAHHGIPFLVAAPRSTVDLATPSGAAIVVEERSPEEVVAIGGVRIAPAGMPALNRAFDVTPASLVTAIVTEAGVARPPSEAALRHLLAEP
jgi:methylthioribose-1-phosphate isomerase